MDKSLGTLLHFWGVFQFTQAQPLPSPHKQCWTCTSRIFSASKLCMGLRAEGEETNARKFRKGSTVWWGNPEWQKNMNIASLSQGPLSMIVQVWFQDNCFFEWFLQCALSAVLFLTKMGGRLHMSSFFTASLCFLHLLQYLRKKKVNKININLLLHNFYLPNFTHPPQQGQHKNLMNFPRLIL